MGTEKSLILGLFLKLYIYVSYARTAYCTLYIYMKRIHVRAANFVLCFHKRKMEIRKYLSTLPSCNGNRRQARENFTPGLLQNYVSVYYRVTSHPSGINRANILLAAVYSFIIFFFYATNGTKMIKLFVVNASHHTMLLTRESLYINCRKLQELCIVVYCMFRLFSYTQF